MNKEQQILDYVGLNETLINYVNNNNDELSKEILWSLSKQKVYIDHIGLEKLKNKVQVLREKIYG